MTGGCYYAATANPHPVAAPLAGEIRADVAIIGAGLTGLSAALRLSEAGARVVLLEAATVGAGASGVSGGQLIPGFRHGAVELIARFGEARARALIDLTLAARDTMAGLVADHALACDLRLTGHLTAASFAADLADFDAEATALDRLGFTGHRLLSAAETRDHVDGSYHGGFLDPAGGHVHPLNYCLALAARATAQGARLFEHSPAIAVTPGTPASVTTPDGRVLADQVILACDARIADLSVKGRATPGAGRLMPVWSYIIATEPLGPRAAELLPTNVAVSDTRFALDYYRRAADDRLLFAGGERYVLAAIDDITGFVRPRLARTFPALGNVRIDHSWAGIVAVTTSRFPQIGSDAGLFWAHGYSGHGLLLAQASGRALADAILGDRRALDLLAALPSRDWPGGAALRQPLYTAGMLWFALNDHLRGALRPARNN
jgi:gamma-glutamylputrescine oxidase